MFVVKQFYHKDAGDVFGDQVDEQFTDSENEAKKMVAAWSFGYQNYDDANTYYTAEYTETRGCVFIAK